MASIYLIRRENGERVEAELREGVGFQDIRDAEREWISERNRIQSALSERGVRSEAWPQTLHWSWTAKSAHRRGRRATHFAIYCENRCQAFMQTSVRGEKLGLSSSPDVYVNFLETAPWNWAIPMNATPRRFRGPGTHLMQAAVRQSLALGFHGRVALHALPQADNFYLGLGMIPIDALNRVVDERYFELSPEAAVELLKKEPGP